MLYNFLNKDEIIFLKSKYKYGESEKDKENCRLKIINKTIRKNTPLPKKLTSKEINTNFLDGLKFYKK